MKITIPKRGVLVAICLSAVVVVGARPEPGEVPSQPKGFGAQQTKGDVRVVLMQVSRTTVLSREYMQGEAAAQHTFAVPCVYVEYLVEYLAETPPKTGPAICQLMFAVNGKRVAVTPSVVGGGIGVTLPYSASRKDKFGFAPPTVRDPKRSFIRENSVRGIRLGGADAVDVTIVTGFGGARHEFVFRNVPLY